LCGGKGIEVTRADELEAAINDALAYDGPALVEIISDALLV
jgi:thiamine pyrophosphate-dependent acetolactate synthase large subunit-like protein